MEIVLRPVAFLVLFGLAILVAWALHKLIPEGRFKRALYERQPLIPENEVERRNWKPVLYLAIATIVQFAIIGGFMWWYDV